MIGLDGTRRILFRFSFLLAFLATSGWGCGEDRKADEGFFDRYDACERVVSLCGLSRDKLEPCVQWVEENYPNQVDRILLVQCVMAATDCASMNRQCGVQGDWLGFSAHLGQGEE